MIAEDYSFPPTYKLILKSLMPTGHLKVLDLGCGKGTAGESLNSKKQHEFIGIDIYQPYINICKKRGYYKQLIRKDLTKVKITRKSFDVVLLLQVIEHLDKKSAKDILNKAIKAAKKRVIISVPNGHCQQDAYEGNLHHRHLSAWLASDLNKLGFKVYGQGFKIIYGSESYGAGKKTNLWQKIGAICALVILPLIMIYPQFGAQLIGVKYIDGKK